MTIRITWYVEDGYVNPGPQTAEIEEEDIFEDDMTEGDKEKAIDEFIREEFQNNISWYIGDVEYE